MPVWPNVFRWKFKVRSKLDRLQQARTLFLKRTSLVCFSTVPFALSFTSGENAKDLAPFLCISSLNSSRVSPLTKCGSCICLILKSSYHLHMPFQFCPGSILRELSIIAMVADAQVEGSFCVRNCWTSVKKAYPFFYWRLSSKIFLPLL